MKIGNINNYYNQNKAPCFKDFKREVIKGLTGGLTQDVLWRNNTSVYRNDLPWTTLLKLLEEKYADDKQVSVVFYACSIGLEIYSYIIEVLEKCNPKSIQKFTPVIAKDIDPFVINIANSKLVTLEDFEIERINQHTNGHFNDYFEKNGKVDKKYSPTKKITDLATFSVGDFTKEYKDLPKNNLILFVRNCWPYFTECNVENLAKKLYEHLGNKCTLLTGNYDSSFFYDENIFINAGFKQTKIPHVYEK